MINHAEGSEMSLLQARVKSGAAAWDGSQAWQLIMRTQGIKTVRLYYNIWQMPDDLSRYEYDTRRYALLFYMNKIINEFKNRFTRFAF